MEDDFIDQIEGVIDLLSSTHVFVFSTFGSTPDLGRSVEEMPIATWDSLAEEANLKAAAKSAAGAALAALTLNAANQKLSRRQLHINEESALKMENEASELRAGATALITAKDAVVAARAAVEKEALALAAKTASDGNEAATGGVLIAAMKSALQEHHISVQRYWNATLVGPDARRFLAAYEAILETLAAKITASNGPQIAAEFTARHSAVLKQLAVVSHLTRKTEKLSALELDQLEFACTAFGDAFRLHYNQNLTVKGHIVEQHVADSARKYGNCDAFCEDGLESLHPWDTRCRLITRTMRNPQARHRATTRHLGIKVQAPIPSPSALKRKSSKAASTAASMTAAQQPLWGQDSVFPSTF